MNEWHNGTVKDRVGEIWVGDIDLGIVSTSGNSWNFKKNENRQKL